MDWDGDGDNDLVVSCPDKPYNGIYFFENPGGKDAKMPVFKKPVRLGKGHSNIRARQWHYADYDGGLAILFELLPVGRDPVRGGRAVWLRCASPEAATP